MTNTEIIRVITGLEHEAIRHPQKSKCLNKGNEVSIQSHIHSLGEWLVKQNPADRHQ